MQRKPPEPEMVPMLSANWTTTQEVMAARPAARVPPARKVCPVKWCNKAAHAIEDCQIFLDLGQCTIYVCLPETVLGLFKCQPQVNSGPQTRSATLSGGCPECQCLHLLQTVTPFASVLRLSGHLATITKELAQATVSVCAAQWALPCRGQCRCWRRRLRQGMGRSSSPSGAPVTK
jgi:hypothetical protein